MSAINPADYVFRPGESIILDDDFDLDGANLHGADGTPITEATLEAEAIDAA